MLNNEVTQLGFSRTGPTCPTFVLAIKSPSIWGLWISGIVVDLLFGCRNGNGFRS